MEEEIEWGYILFTEEERKKIDRMLAEVEERRNEPGFWIAEEEVEERLDKYIKEYSNAYKTNRRSLKRFS